MKSVSSFSVVGIWAFMVVGFSFHDENQQQKNSAVLSFSVNTLPTAKTIGRRHVVSSAFQLAAAPDAAAAAAATDSFIDTELRGAAMKLHTRSQAPREGQAVEPKSEPYIPTRQDYLSFLVDSKHVYEALDDVVQSNDELSKFRNTGLERTKALTDDIEFMCQEYNLECPPVGRPGTEYAKLLRELGDKKALPEFMCHYYNFVFAHWAGGLMIGKKMAALLLDKKTLNFYKFDGDDLNATKRTVKDEIEDMVSRWTREEKDRCVGETAGAFKGGGSINSYLSGGQSPH
eukprot:CAMPEP_0113494490 /NCGR_PEP_ID=MMETSP0014_2-20120614/29132_1 /TAXON_ID=2857 /ORGANISM="Nitzschia sp." /LENGTH=287 /DNA_ID=CAMNT_0000388381 /DNA_START=307 /DNA_END=1170 /DNA_ORIENTATION=+ /assembly_acc=CAM_ASM_000159